MVDDIHAVFGFEEINRGSGDREELS